MHNYARYVFTIETNQFSAVQKHVRQKRLLPYLGEKMKEKNWDTLCANNNLTETTVLNTREAGDINCWN